jgi:hypothetical protein
MGNGAVRFVPTADGWYWLEVKPFAPLPYSRLLLFRFESGRLHRIDRLDLGLPDGSTQTIELPGASPDGVTEYRRVEASPKLTWSWGQ